MKDVLLALVEVLEQLIFACTYALVLVLEIQLVMFLILDFVVVEGNDDERVHAFHDRHVDGIFWYNEDIDRVFHLKERK